MTSKETTLLKKKLWKHQQKLTKKDAERVAQNIAQRVFVHTATLTCSNPEHTEEIQYPPSWEKGCPIVADFFKELIRSKILIPDLNGRMDCVDILRLFKKMRPGKKLPANWITTANLILGYTTETEQPLDFCPGRGTKGDCFYGYTLLLQQP